MIDSYYRRPPRLPARGVTVGRSTLLLLLLLPMLAALGACEDRGDEAPHPALLYNICDVAQTADGSTVFHLYRPDSDSPIILTANEFSAIDKNGNPLAAGTSGLLGYYSETGQPYVNSNITVDYWATINNMHFTTLKEDDVEEFHAAWPDSEPVEYLAGWRGGKKLYLRLRLPYSSHPRNFALLADPTTLDKPIPTLYLYHSRTEASPTFNRQYYIAFDIADIWDISTARGVRLIVNDALTSSPDREITFSKNQ